MIETIAAVLKDLLDFVFELPSNTKKAKSIDQPTLFLPEEKTPVLLSVKTEEKAPTTPPVATGAYGETAYVVAKEAVVLVRPVLSYDGVLLRLPYAAKVQVIGYEGRFARVELGEKTGFVLKDDITHNKADVFPVFLNNEIYSANHPDTKKIRTLTKDEFFVTELFLPLQAIEFVEYRLSELGFTISWPQVRPRLAGQWQTILKGRLGVQIGVLPKAGAVLEYTKGDGTGFVGYTKAVRVDESIVLEGVGRLIEGEYRLETISKEEWQEWRPIWIAVS